MKDELFTKNTTIKSGLSTPSPTTIANPSPFTFKCAHSPCPNDLFIFAAWQRGLIPSALRPEFLVTDIQSLNERALARSVDLCKVSAAIVADLEDDYTLLSVGAAVAYGDGPKLVARKPYTLAELARHPLASPGSTTMAHRLLRKFLSPPHLEEMHFSRIIPSIVSGAWEGGIVIHESRFAIANYGLYEIADLGALWLEKMQLPLPLGALVAKKSLGEEAILAIEQTVRASIDFARNHFDLIKAAVIEQGQEHNEQTLRSHIDLYVTDDTFQLSEQARRAFKKLKEIRP